MINLTIGSGGDYAGPAEAYDFLVTLGPLADDYTFNLISNVTITAWNAILSRIDCNGHTVLFTCSFNKANAETPLSWYRVELSGANGHMSIIQDLGATVNDKIFVEWWIYKHITNTAIILLSISTQQSSDVMTWGIDNCWFIGTGTAGESGIGAGNTGHYYDINKVVMYNLNRSLNLFPGGFVPGDDFPDRKHIKNVTIYTAISGDGVIVGDLAGNNIYFENVAVFHQGLGVCWDKSVAVAPDRYRITNCSDDDNTIVTNMTPSATITDCLANLVIADEIETLVDTSDDFLKLKIGAITADFTREPAGNVNVGDVIKFTPEVALTPGSANLGDSGIAVAGMVVDIRGKAIPSINGEYPIGAHVQEYST